MPLDFNSTELARLETDLAEASVDVNSEAISMKLRSLLAGLCVSRGAKVGRAYEIMIPDDVYGKLTTGGLLKYHRDGAYIVVRYEPAAVEGRRVESRVAGFLELEA